MCPLCIGSALLALTGAGSAGGLAVFVARAGNPITELSIAYSGSGTGDDG